VATTTRHKHRCNGCANQGGNKREEELLHTRKPAQTQPPCRAAQEALWPLPISIHWRSAPLPSTHPVNLVNPVQKPPQLPTTTGYPIRKKSRSPIPLRMTPSIAARPSLPLRPSVQSVFPRSNLLQRFASQTLAPNKETKTAPNVMPISATISWSTSFPHSPSPLPLTLRSLCSLLFHQNQNQNQKPKLRTPVPSPSSDKQKTPR
jgi:hypothetical protein